MPNGWGFAAYHGCALAARLRSVSVLLIVLAACSAATTRLYEKPDSIEVVETRLIDPARSRTVPIRMYLPRMESRAPLIVFSHGLGNSRAGYSYLGNAWSRQGYAVVFVQHSDSDETLSLRGLYRAAFDRKVWRNRPLDVSFVLDQLRPSSADPVLAAAATRIDMDRIGMSGHSYGAYTALVLAGGLVELDGKRVSLADPRIDAIVTLSSPRMRAIQPEADAYAPIRIPVLHLTGTKDSSLVFATRPRIRRVPFERIANAEQYLVTLTGARHGSFSDDGYPRDPDEYHDEIAAFTTAFWDGWLRGDRVARARLLALASPTAKVETGTASP